MRKISFFIISGLLLALLVSSVFSAGCQKSSSTSSTPTTETEKPSIPDNNRKSGGQESKAPEKATVTIKSDGMDPQEATVKAGGTVVWKNESGADAQIHVDQLGGPGDTVSDSGTYQQKFDSAGSYSYHNHLSSSMTGTITVE